MKAMLSRYLKTFFLCLGLFGLLCLGAEAGTNISKTSDPSWEPRITVDSAGNVHVCWLDQYSSSTGDIFYTKYTKATTTWSTAQNISQSGNASSPMNQSYRACDIDHDGSNNIYVVWTEGSVIKLKIQSGGSWGSVFTVNSSGASDCPRLGVDSSGNIFICWWYTSGQVYSRARINGSWEESKRISNSSKRAKVPDIGVGPNTVFVVYMEKQPDDYRTAWVQRNKTFNATWTTSTEVYHGSIPHSYSTVKVDASGVAHVAYLEEQAEGVRTAKYCSKSGTSGWSSPITISKTATLHYPASAVMSTSFYPAWQVGGWGNGQSFNYNSKVNGSWAGEQKVPSSNGVTYGDISVDTDGKVYCVWENAGEIYYQLMDGSTPPPPPPPPPPPENKAPTANFNIWPSTNPWAPVNMQFDGGISSDPDGYLAAWDWVFNEGDKLHATDSGANIYHQFDSRGSFTVTLTVRDNGGLTDRKTKSFTVLGLYPPLSQAKEWFSDESLFQVRYGYKVTWAKNPENDKIASINRYRIYRKSEDEDTWHYLGEVQASGVLEYKDIDLALEDKDILGYSVTAVDTDNHESAVGGTGSGSQGPPPVNNEPDKVNGKPKLPIKN